MLLSFAHHLGVDSFSLLWTQTVADVSCILGFSDYSNEQSDSNITVCVSMTVFDAWGQKALTVYIYIYLAFIFIQSNSQVRNTLGGAEGWCGLEFELATLQLKGDPPAPELQLPPRFVVHPPEHWHLPVYIIYIWVIIIIKQTLFLLIFRTFLNAIKSKSVVCSFVSAKDLLIYCFTMSWHT